MRKELRLEPSVKLSTVQSKKQSKTKQKSFSNYKTNYLILIISLIERVKGVFLVSVPTVMVLVNACRINVV